MSVKVTFHSGEMHRYSVLCKCRDAAVRSIWSVKEELKKDHVEVECVVFASSLRDARKAAIEKMTDKLLRHRNVRSHWTAHDVTEA